MTRSQEAGWKRDELLFGNSLGGNFGVSAVDQKVGVTYFFVFDICLACIAGICKSLSYYLKIFNILIM